MGYYQGNESAPAIRGEKEVCRVKKSKTLKRERVNRALEGIFGYPLTIVEAPIGYGKTTAVREFLSAKGLPVVWTSFFSEDDAAGVMAGKDGRFSPKAGTTRAEAASMLHRYIRLTIDPDTAQGWAENDAGQWLYYKNGKTLTGWQTKDGVKYHFYSTGELQTGWVKSGDGWYFYSGNKMLTGWQTKDGKWYYFQTDGSLARDAEVDGYEVDENGVRKE